MPSNISVSTRSLGIKSSEDGLLVTAKRITGKPAHQVPLIRHDTVGALQRAGYGADRIAMPELSDGITY
jgi:hypothetical protein